MKLAAVIATFLLLKTAAFSQGWTTQKLSYEYGPETFVMVLPPVKFSFDYYPVQRYQGPYIGMDFSVMGLVAVWGSVGAHVGYKYGDVGLENNLNLFFLLGGAPGPSETKWEVQFNPKVNWEFDGAFLKIGPSFDLVGSYPIGHSKFPFLRVLEVPLNIDVGLYENEDYKYSQFHDRIVAPFIRRYVYTKY